MLEEILMYLNNWFTVPDGKTVGTYKVENGSITLPFLKDGQYFRIVGSIHNDGLHQYPASDLTDEKFEGVIYPLAIPKVIIRLSEDISAWAAKNEPSAFTSESFGGYAYSKATNEKGIAAGWEDVFSSRLAPWRKLKGSERP